MKISKIATVAAFVLLLSIAVLAQTYNPPQGRLTLSSSQAVMTSDVLNATTIYYVDYVGPLVPLAVGNGTLTYSSAKVTYPLTLTLTSSQTSGKIYDVFFFDDTIHGAFQIGVGPAWSSSTSRGTGTGTTEISQNYYDGVWRNDESFTPTNGTISLPTLSAGDGTYLGSVYMTANGETGVTMKPASAAGGTNNIIGIWNAYNRVPIYSLCRDSNNDWSEADTGGWEEADTSSSNRVTWVDGLQQTSVLASFTVLPEALASGGVGLTGVDLDSTSATPNLVADWYFGVTSDYSTLNIEEAFPPQMGLHYVQAMQNVGGTNTVYFLGQYPLGYENLTLKSEY